MSGARNWVPISTAVRGVLERAGLGYIVYEAKLRENWAALMGERAVEMAELDSLRDFRLKVRVRHSAWRQELHFEREEIRRRANGILGFDLVREVILV